MLRCKRGWLISREWEFLSLSCQGGDEVAFSTEEDGKGNLEVWKAWLHPELISTPDMSAQARCLTGSWRNAMHIIPSLSCAGSWGFGAPVPLMAHRRALLPSSGTRVCMCFKAEGVLCLPPVFLPLICWQGCQSSRSMTGLERVWRAWVWCVYYVGIHISFQWLVTLPRCL